MARQQPRMASLEECIRGRHSTRMYKPDPVDEKILRECLQLAQCAPSNSNIQNWRLSLASGPARDRIAAAIQKEVAEHGSNVPPLPDKYKHFRSEFGKLLYGPDGYNIPRSETEQLKNAQLRNYDFFGAPVHGVISMDAVCQPVDAMAVGMFIQTFMLALVERGLASCMQISVCGYPEVLKQEHRLDDDQFILCGIAIGWPADHSLNSLQTTREPLESAVQFLTE